MSDVFSADRNRRKTTEERGKGIDMALKEKLKELGLTDEQVTEAMKELEGEFVPKGRFNDVNTELKGLKDQLQEANDQIKEFAELDVEGIKKAAADWEDKYKASEAQREEDALKSSIEHAIRDAGGKNAKSIMVHLDMEALKKSKDRKADIATALEAVKETESYLFKSDEKPEDDPVKVVKGGNNAPIKMTKEEIDKIQDSVARRRAIAENMNLYEKP